MRRPARHERSARDHAGGEQILIPPARDSRASARRAEQFIAEAAGTGRGRLGVALADQDARDRNSVRAARTARARRALCYNFYKAFELGPHGGITLFRTDGIALARWPEGKWNTEPSAAFQALVGQETTGYSMIKSPFDGYLKYAGFERASQYPIIVTVAMSEDQVLAGWRQDLRNDLLVATILMGGIAVFAILLWREFSRRTAVARMLREREERYRLLAENIADVVVRLDRDGRFLFVSQSVEAMLGLKPAELVGRSCFDFVHPDDLAAVTQAAAELTDWSVTRTVMFKTFRADTSVAWVEMNFKLAGTAGAQRPIEVVGVLRDVSERQKMEQELNALNRRLSELATTDGLTGLANRRTFDAALPREFRDRDVISIIMIDIDHFKHFNDSFGHQAGDECLKRVALVIAAADNTTALPARYGGEEFAIILPGFGEQEALDVAEAIRLNVCALAIANPASDHGVVTVSLGVAGRTSDTANGASLLGEADLALYQAKRAGRNRSVASATLDRKDHSAGRKQIA